MDNIFRQLVEICKQLDFVILNYIAYPILNKYPSATVEDSYGDIHTLIYNEGLWVLKDGIKF